MKWMLLFVLPAVAVLYLAMLIDYPNDPDVGLDIVDLVSRYEYPIETHEVVTEDGYIIILHRIPYGSHNSKTKKRGPVLLSPSLLTSAIDFLNMGPNVSLGFILADSGYDVWLLNPRGTTWSKRHKSLNLDVRKDYEKFWNFSLTEIGYYDIPASIDYILKNTNKKDLHYVGLSQGIPTFLIMASKLPEYQKKVRLVTAIAPSATFSGESSGSGRFLFRYIDSIKKILGLFNSLEVLPHYTAFKIIPRVLCKDGSIVQGACVALLDYLAGVNYPNKTKIPVIATNAPAGASVKQIQHFSQIYLRDKFSDFDYGEAENLLKYGQSEPPNFNLKLVSVPVFVVYGQNDTTITPKAIKRFIKSLPNVTSIFEVEGYNHADFLYAHNAKTRVYTKVVNVMKKADDL